MAAKKKAAPKKKQSEPKPAEAPEPTKALLDKQNAEKAELRDAHNRRRALFGE